MKKVFLIIVTLAFGGWCGCASSSPATSSAANPDKGDRELKRGLYWYHKGCIIKASTHLHAAHEHYCLNDQQTGVARSLVGLANLHRQTGNLENAMSFYDAAISVARRCDDQTVTAQALSNKAAILIESDDLPAAEVLLDEAQQLSRETGPVFATVLNHRAVLLMKEQQFDDAASLLNQAESATAGHGSHNAATIRFTRGRLMMRTGNYSQALTLFQETLELDRQAGFARGMGDDLAAMADIHEQLGQDEAALDCLDRSIKIHALIDNREMVLNNLERLLSLAQRTGTDVRVTVHFVNQWLAGEAMDAMCR